MCWKKRKMGWKTNGCRWPLTFAIWALRLFITAGSLTAKVTFANVGTLLCYTQGQFRLRLHGSGIEDTRAYDLPLRAGELQPGEERMISQRLDIRGLDSGEYDVHAGLFLAGTEYPVSFGIEGRISDGYYEGRLILRL